MDDNLNEFEPKKNKIPIKKHLLILNMAYAFIGFSCGAFSYAGKRNFSKEVVLVMLIISVACFFVVLLTSFLEVLIALEEKKNT